MRPELTDQIVEQFEQGHLFRRQLASRLMGLGAVRPPCRRRRWGGRSEEHVSATGLNHVALDVTDVPRSRDFYVKHLGLEVIRDGGDDNCFLGSGGHFFLTLFRAEKPGLNHYCYTITDYNVDQAEETLKDAGLKVRREAGRIYFDDPDGIEVQVAGA